MKKILFIMIILTVVFYDAYQIKYYFETQNALEKELKTKSEKISEVIKYFMKEKIEKGYVIEEVFYNRIFDEFISRNTSGKEYVVLNNKLISIEGNLTIDLNSLLPKLREISEQKIKAIELYNDSNYILIGGYRNNGIAVVKYDIPEKLKESISIDEFKKTVMEKGDIKEIGISTDKPQMVCGANERIVEKEINIYDSLNETEKTFVISIKFDMSNYLRMTNKNMTDILFSIIITIFIILLTGLYGYINIKYDKTKEYLKEKEKDILAGSIASGVAHEIRNPLNAINYTIEYMKALITDDEMKKNLAAIKDEIRRIDKSLKEFLDIRKEIALHKEKISINKIVEEIALILGNEFKAHNIKLEIEDKYELNIEGDYDKIKEVFLNILKNSKESIAGGNGRINIKIREKEILFSDNGIGMEKENIEQMFNLYYTTKEDGNGIGMYRAKKIIEGHNGKIIVKSQKGKGTETKLIFKEVI